MSEEKNLKTETFCFLLVEVWREIYFNTAKNNTFLKMNSFVSSALKCITSYCETNPPNNN